ncbi:PREDICTED: calvin cycle protein CP12-1, chloroplastic-like [Fragaria vesca subsp. vesca]|uniref:calvin cycle protein CP12-1, chloroplastic-like n=1 Tax=Fragaria vesca subsp. vesca TaxID=101020 RepID=UPI0002C3127E|nr:PREDICTED: calvin cycle protein CP12-1, chloroplastic-like [Fragaria vesca subsp. vesca]
MASVAGVSSLSTPGVFARAAETPKVIKPAGVSFGYSFGQVGSGRMRMIRPVAAAPDKLSDKVRESIKEAEQACSEDPASGECVAAWDEVEELSAAASHKRDNEKNKDPLETYCNDNPETDECRTYDN